MLKSCCAGRHQKLLFSHLHDDKPAFIAYQAASEILYSQNKAIKGTAIKLMFTSHSLSTHTYPEGEAFISLNTAFRWVITKLKEQSVAKERMIKIKLNKRKKRSFLLYQLNQSCYRDIQLQCLKLTLRNRVIKQMSTLNRAGGITLDMIGMMIVDRNVASDTHLPKQECSSSCNVRWFTKAEDKSLPKPMHKGRCVASPRAYQSEKSLIL